MMQGFWAAGAALLAMLAAGCQLSVGENTAAAEFDRQRAIDRFQIVETLPERAVIVADGRTVAVTPPEGACITEDAIDVSERSAFVLYTDCALVTGPDGAPLAAINAQDAPFAGLVTLSVSGEGRVALWRLSAFVETDEGQQLLARSRQGGSIAVVEQRRIGEMLFVLVENRDEQAMALLSRRFWRCFLELNGRMAVITVSGFRARPLADDALFAEVWRHAVALAEGNAQPVPPAPSDAAPAKPAPSVSIPDIGEVRTVGKARR
ncbi:MAG: hypothetical protein AAF677_11270 [Pseudomonadota bacterium]